MYGGEHMYRLTKIYHALIDSFCEYIMPKLQNDIVIRVFVVDHRSSDNSQQQIECQQEN